MMNIRKLYKQLHKHNYIRVVCHKVANAILTSLALSHTSANKGKAPLHPKGTCKGEQLPIVV